MDVMKWSNATSRVITQQKILSSGILSPESAQNCTDIFECDSDEKAFELATQKLNNINNSEESITLAIDTLSALLDRKTTRKLMMLGNELNNIQYRRTRNGITAVDTGQDGKISSVNYEDIITEKRGTEIAREVRKEMKHE